jgi:O-antigen ligase
VTLDNLAVRSALIVGWFASVALVGAFLLDLSAPLQWAIAFGLLGAGALLAFKSPVHALTFLPVTALLGPITRVAAGPMQLHLGDAYLAMLVLVVGIRQATRPLVPSPSRNLLFVLGGLVLLSWLLSADSTASMVAVVGIGQLLMVYMLTLNTVRARGDVNLILLSWVGAVALSCLVVVVAYVQGRVLLIGGDLERMADLGARSLEAGVLFRGTFFVAPFIFSLASALLLALTLVVLHSGSAGERLFLLAMVPIFLVTALVMGNKSLLGGVALGIVALLAWSLTFPGAIRRTFALVLGGCLVAGVVAVSVSQVVEGAQLLLLRERLGDPTSFELRIAVWRNVVAYMGSAPKTFLIGLGPDISIRAVDLPVLRGIFLGAGVQQEAVDNGYLYAALNYGVPALITAMGLAVATLWRLSRRLLEQPDALALALWISLAAWLAMSVTQQTGISKPVFFLAQVIALAERLEWLGRNA